MLVVDHQYTGRHRLSTPLGRRAGPEPRRGDPCERRASRGAAPPPSRCGPPGRGARCSPDIIRTGSPAAARCPPGHLDAAHPGHDHVRDQQVDLARVLEQAQRVGPGWPRSTPCSRPRSRMRLASVRTAASSSTRSTVSLPPGSATGRLTGPVRRRGASAARQVDLELGPRARLAVDPDVAARSAVTIPYTVASPSPVPSPGALGGEERLEDAGLRSPAPSRRRCRVTVEHARSGPGASSGARAAAAASSSTLPVSIVSVPPVGHGVARVDRQVHQHLLDLPGSARTAARLGGQLVTSSTSSPISAAQQLLDVASPPR